MNSLAIESIVVRYLVWGPHYRGKKVRYLEALIDVLLPERDYSVPRCPFCGRVFKYRYNLQYHVSRGACAARTNELVSTAVKLYRLVSGKYRETRRAVIYMDGGREVRFPNFKAMCRALLPQINSHSNKVTGKKTVKMGARA